MRKIGEKIEDLEGFVVQETGNVELSTEVELGALERKLGSLARNERLRRLNRAAVQIRRPFVPLLKETDASGDRLIPAILPASVVAPAPLALEETAAAASTPLLLSNNGIFPDSHSALMSLTHHQILVLVQFYNDDFGIQPGDSIETRREKFFFFVSQ